MPSAPSASAATRPRASRESAGGDHRDLDLVGGRRDQHQARDVVLTRMTRALEAVDADAVHTEALCLDGVAHRGALVQHLDAVVVEHRQVRRRVGARGLDDLDTRVDDHLAVLVVRRRIDARQDRQVHAERLVGQIPRLGDLVGQIRRRRLGQRGDEAERARIGHRGNQFRATHPLHTALGDGMLDTERLGELRLDRQSYLLLRTRSGVTWGPCGSRRRGGSPRR